MNSGREQDEQRTGFAFKHAKGMNGEPVPCSPYARTDLSGSIVMDWKRFAMKSLSKFSA